MSVGAVQNWESERHEMRDIYADKVADALTISAQWLLTGEGDSGLDQPAIDPRLKGLETAVEDARAKFSHQWAQLTATDQWRIALIMWDELNAGGKSRISNLTDALARTPVNQLSNEGDLSHE